MTDAPAGRGLIWLSWTGTLIFSVSAVLATVSVHTFQGLLIIVALVLFAIGTGAFVLAYLLAIARSRDDLIGMGGLFFLAGTAPASVRWHLLGSFALEVVVATVTASLGLFLLPADASNPLAFGALTPIFGLGLAGLWGARFGQFAARADNTSSDAPTSA